MALTNKIYKDYYKKPKLRKLPKRSKRNLIKRRFATFVIKYSTVKNQPSSKSETIVTSLESIVVAAHNTCNLRCRKPMILPVIFHNLQGYDSHLFIKQLAKMTGQLTCIPSTEEKYISFPKKIKVDEYKSRRTGETVSLNFEI